MKTSTCKLPDWPRFYWDTDQIAGILPSLRHRQGPLTGHMEALGFSLQQEAILETLTADVVNSSEIEGERLDDEEVRSSIARRLGMDAPGLLSTDRNVEGIVEMMLDATRHYDQPMTVERLCSWHSSLFPAGRSGMRRIRTARGVIRGRRDAGGLRPGWKGKGPFRGAHSGPAEGRDE